MPSRPRATSSSASSPGPTHPPAAVAGSRPRPCDAAPRSSGSRCSPRRASRTPTSSTPSRRSRPTRARSWPTATSSRPTRSTIPRLGWINLHFSLLPAWRGAAPVQHAIMAGDEVTGASTFVIERGLDTGPVLGVMTETIRPTDTAGDLLGRLSAAGAGLLVATLDGLESGDLVAVPQPSEGVSLAPKIEVEDARIAWTRPATAVDRLVRGCTPAPGAWTTFRGERLKVSPVTVVAGRRGPGRRRAARRRPPRHEEGRLRRHGHRARPPRHRAGPRQEADGGGRLGPGHAHRGRGAGRR